MRKQRRAARSRGKLTRSLRWLLVTMVALSAYQYLDSGSISWHHALLAKLQSTVGGYATRPEAGWRQAGEQIEKWGARREGSPLPHFDLSGRVVGVLDGDSLIMRTDGGEEHTVRLFGIDTPERGQPHADRARSALLQMVSRQTVNVVHIDTDNFNRIVGTVYLGDNNINLAMVNAGHAWWFQRYAPHERQLQAAEQAARAAGKGLWAQAEPVPPWEWRRRH